MLDAPITGRLFATGLASLVMYAVNRSAPAVIGAALIIYAILTIVDLVADDDEWTETK